MAELHKGFFKPEDTSPRFIQFGGEDGQGWVIAALPDDTLTPICILATSGDLSTDEINGLLASAYSLGVPLEHTFAFIHHLGEGRNAPVTQLRIIRSANGWRVESRRHPHIDLEKWVVEQSNSARR